MQKQITPFYHVPTNSWSYLLADPGSRVCALIDPVLDFEPGAGTVQYDFITQMLKAAAEADLQVKIDLIGKELIETKEQIAKNDKLQKRLKRKRTFLGSLVGGVTGFISAYLITK